MPSLWLDLEMISFVSCGVEPQALLLDGKFYDFELMQLG